jgi:putative phosphoribosyl transferase
LNWKPQEQEDAMSFRDREHAGQLLAAKLGRTRLADPIVLGITRGGLPVALEVARSLGAPLEAVVVRRLGAPGDPEVAVGAIAEGRAVCVNAKALRDLDLTEDEVAALAEREAPDLARRVFLYHGEAPLPDLTGRTVILVDDRASTGTSARAAGRAARARGAVRIVFAAPAVAATIEPELRAEFDDVVALELVPECFAVSYCYQRLDRLRDEDALECVRRARASRAEERSVGPRDAGAQGTPHPP